MKTSQPQKVRATPRVSDGQDQGQGLRLNEGRTGSCGRDAQRLRANFARRSKIDPITVAGAELGSRLFFGFCWIGGELWPAFFLVLHS